MRENFCSQCGYKLESENVFCPGCGTRVLAIGAGIETVLSEQVGASSSPPVIPEPKRLEAKDSNAPEGVSSGTNPVKVTKPLSAGAVIWRLFCGAAAIFFLSRAFTDITSVAKGVLGHATNGDSKLLYDAFMSAHSGDYIPGQYEADYVDGRVLMTCKVGGKYDGYFGYFHMRTTFVAGHPVTNAEPEKMYAWLVLTGDGHQGGATSLNAETLFDDIRADGCDPPTKVE